MTNIREQIEDEARALFKQGVPLEDAFNAIILSKHPVTLLPINDLMSCIYRGGYNESDYIS